MKVQLTPDTEASPTRPRRSLSRVSFSKDTLLVQPPPTPGARTWVGKYATHEATSRVWREKLNYGLNMGETSHAFGRVSVWARKGGEVDHIAWSFCCACLGSCMIEQQRQAMEVKLHRWHKERGEAVGEPLLTAHQGSGGLFSLLRWPCNRAWLVAENVGALSNFKAVQGLDGWPTTKPWASPSRGRAHRDTAPAAHAMEREMQPTEEVEMLVKPMVGRDESSRDELSPGSTPDEMQELQVAGV